MKRIRRESNMMTRLWTTRELSGRGRKRRRRREKGEGRGEERGEGGRGGGGEEGEGKREGREVISCNSILLLTKDSKNGSHCSRFVSESQLHHDLCSVVDGGRG